MMLLRGLGRSTTVDAGVVLLLGLGRNPIAASVVVVAATDRDYQGNARIGKYAGEVRRGRYRGQEILAIRADDEELREMVEMYFLWRRKR